jgi:hypothetical protein
MFCVQFQFDDATHATTVFTDDATRILQEMFQVPRQGMYNYDSWTIFRG